MAINDNLLTFLISQVLSDPVTEVVITVPLGDGTKQTFFMEKLIGFVEEDFCAIAFERSSKIPSYIVGKPVGVEVDLTQRAYIKFDEDAYIMELKY